MVEYPTAEQLEKIKTWFPIDFHEFMSYVQSLWAYSGWGWKRDEDIYFVSTGGWSGNEDLVYAMRENFVFWSLYFVAERQGGHFLFGAKTQQLEKFLDSFPF